MREAIGRVYTLAMIVAMPVGALCRMMDNPGGATWAARVGSIVVLVASPLVFWLTRPPKDLAPDFLRELVSASFDRGGFCFDPPETRRGVDRASMC